MPTRRNPLVPPGGFAGWAQQTPAAQALLRGGTSRPRKKAAKKRATTTKRRATTKKRKTTRRSGAKKKPAYMVKGSRAAKMHMKKLRAKRRKR